MPATEITQDKNSWERAFQEGNWGFLDSESEYAHYSVVASFLQRRGEPYTLLDIGCGFGSILKYLDLSRLTQYTGVDLAQSALDKITPRRPQDRYICSSLEEYVPDGQWDIILFNEVLCYTGDPVAPFLRMEKALRSNGCFATSLLRKSNPLAYNNRCLRKIRRHFGRACYKIIEAVEIQKLYVNAAWQVFLVQPPPKT